LGGEHKRKGHYGLSEDRLTGDGTWLSENSQKPMSYEALLFPFLGWSWGGELGGLILEKKKAMGGESNRRCGVCGVAMSGDLERNRKGGKRLPFPLSSRGWTLGKDLCEMRSKRGLRTSPANEG